MKELIKQQEEFETLLKKSKDADLILKYCDLKEALNNYVLETVK